MFQIYKKQHSNLSTAIGQLITGVFYIGMQSWKYSTTLKGENKRTCILQKGDIRFYRKQRELMHSSGFIHLSEKVSPILMTQNNGVKNTTVTQWKTRKHLYLVRVWDDITTRL